MRFLFPLLVIAALSAAPSAAACEPTASDPEIDTCDLAGTGVDASFGGGCVYVDNDLCQPGCLFSVWIYCESNGIEGLQRNDDVRDDTCGGRVESDACTSI